jgi:hypothetical protein
MTISNDETHDQFLERVHKHPLMLRWFSFLAGYKAKYETYVGYGPEDKGRDLIARDIKLEKEFKSFKKLTKRSFDAILWFAQYPDSLMIDKKTGKYGDFGGAVYEVHLFLRDFLAEKRKIREVVYRALKNKNVLKNIISYHQKGIEYAECGCCRESGGEIEVQLRDGTVLNFDEHERLIETHDGWTKLE